MLFPVPPLKRKIACLTVVSSPDPTLCEGKVLVTLEQFLRRARQDYIIQSHVIITAVFSASDL